MAEASYHHRRWYPERADDYAFGTRANIDAGFKLPAVDYVDALQKRRDFTGSVNEVLKDVAVLVCPTVAYTATETDPSFEGGAEKYVFRTMPFDVSGHPALTVPVGNTGSRNLPAGMELVSAPHAEDLLYQVAAAYEQDLGGFARLPV